MSNALWRAEENVERIFGSASDCTSIRAHLRAFRLNTCYGLMTQVECYKRIKGMFGLEISKDYSHVLVGANGERTYGYLHLSQTYPLLPSGWAGVQ